MRVFVSVVQMSHAMQVKPADSEGKAGMSSSGCGPCCVVVRHV